MSKILIYNSYNRICRCIYTVCMLKLCELCNPISFIKLISVDFTDFLFALLPVLSWRQLENCCLCSIAKTQVSMCLFSLNRLIVISNSFCYYMKHFLVCLDSNLDIWSWI